MLACRRLHTPTLSGHIFPPILWNLSLQVLILDPEPLAQCRVSNQMVPLLGNHHCQNCLLGKEEPKPVMFECFDCLTQAEER